MPPTFAVETILYAELQAKYIKVVKSVFEPLGHYARWDRVNLTAPPQPYEPVTGAPVVVAPPTDVRDRVVESVAKEFRLEPEAVLEVVRKVA